MHKTNLFIATALLFVFGMVQGQSTFNSPYSRFGIGDLQQDKNLRNTAMGGISAGDRTAGSINVGNPASYSSFDTLSFVFETGLSGYISQLSTTTAKQSNKNFGIRNIQFGFPIAKNIGACFGLIPLSNVSYNINSVEAIDSVGTVNFNYNGMGGLNQLFLGTGFSPIKNFSIGGNVSYVFGNIIQERNVTFPAVSNFFDQYIENKIRVGDVKFDVGAQYSMKLKNDLLLTIGVSYNFKTELSAKNTFFSRRYTPLGNTTSTIIRDTIINETSDKGNVSLPGGINAGFMLRKAKKWAFGADFSKMDWSNYKIFGVSDSLADNMRLAMGFEFIPNANASKGVFKKTRYRVGGHIGNSYLNLKGNQLNEYGVSLGFGIPVRNLRNVSPNIINLVFEYGGRGTTANGLIKEDYFKISFGINFNERWFQKRKFE